MPVDRQNRRGLYLGGAAIAVSLVLLAIQKTKDRLVSKYYSWADPPLTGLQTPLGIWIEAFAVVMIGLFCLAMIATLVVWGITAIQDILRDGEVNVSYWIAIVAFVAALVFGVLFAILWTKP